MNKIYVVTGLTGKHEDFIEWQVAAYPAADVANLHAKLANEWLREKKCYARMLGKCTPHARMIEKDNPFDADCSIDPASGTIYEVREIGFFLHPDQFMEWIQEEQAKASNPSNKS